MSDAVTRRVIATIEEQLAVAPGPVTPESTFEELNIDSLTGLNLIYELEKEFGVEVPNERVLVIRSVKEIVACLEPLVCPDIVNEGVATRSPR
jgi:acyl carrier protein